MKAPKLRFDVRANGRQAALVLGLGLVLNAGAYLGLVRPHVREAERLEQESEPRLKQVKDREAAVAAKEEFVRAVETASKDLTSLRQDVLSTKRQRMIAVQLEDREAIDNIDELLKVENIDVFFIGPSDLSQSMGHPGNPKAPAVAQAIESSFRKMINAGRTPGTPATAENLRGVLDKGVRYIYTHLPRLLSSSARSYLAHARP